MATAPTTSDTRPHATGRTGSRAAGFAIGIVWAWAFGALVTLPLALPPGGASPFDTSPDSGAFGEWLLRTGQGRSDTQLWVFALAAVLAVAMAALIRYRPAVLPGVAIGLVVFLAVGWLIGPWFGTGLSHALVNPVGYASTIVRDPAVVGVFALLIGLAVMRRRPGRDRR
ncbi:hypothetical protein [Tersicoccus sp. Bi-70]|uniref:hypothetical protein n=1 Tax=Tersicoccus sp. Bi-70 TaxID=1897634 RepID=UPI000977FFD3|nr:hypothetical protein [Tersicoccus sp. Bi-70]OMH36948.1 hypothetical protein BGP79_14595 [Tersicoccus sp. Bi-70]